MTKTWKRNAVVAVVLMFICVGVYLNWTDYQSSTAEAVELADTVDVSLLDDTAQETIVLTDGATVESLTEDVMVVNGDYDALITETTTDTSVSEYFAAIRLARQESRDSAVELLQETIAYETGADDSAASLASEQLESMVETALMESQIEGLVIAKGYEDCVAYMSEEGISVAVAAPEGGLEADAVAQICDIVVTQSDYTPSELKIIEVK